jgi:hypothetical protein
LINFTADILLTALFQKLLATVVIIEIDTAFKDLLFPVMLAILSVVSATIVIVVIIIVTAKDSHAATVVVSAVSSMAIMSISTMVVAAFFIIVPSALETCQFYFRQERRVVYASELIINLLLITWITGSKVGSSYHHATSLPLFMWINHGIADDAMTARLVKLAALLVAAALGVFTLIAIVAGGENALCWTRGNQRLTSIEDGKGKNSPHSALLQFHHRLRTRGRGFDSVRCDSGGVCAG